jgi:hypothetical protein
MEDGARNAATAYKDARALLEKVKARPQSAANDALGKQLDTIAPVEAADTGGGGGRAGRGGRGGGGAPAEPPAPPNLSNIGAQMVAAAQGMQAAEMAPTASQVQACNQEQAAYAALMAKWTALKAKINGPAVAAAAPAAGAPGAKK